MLEWWKRRRPPATKRVIEFSDMTDFEVPEEIVVYIIGFWNDDLTIQTATWIRDILTSDRIDQNRIVRFTNNGKNAGDLAIYLDDKSTRVEIFCGHGSHDGLFGPPFGEFAGHILSDRTHVIYSLDMITDTPSSMFAFCCQAAQTFGRVFSSYKDKKFLGFKGDIPFPLELYDDLKFIFQRIGRDILQKGQISVEHRDMFLESIDELLSQSSSYRNPTLVELWLGEYKRHLKIYC